MQINKVYLELIKICFCFTHCSFVCYFKANLHLKNFLMPLKTYQFPDFLVLFWRKSLKVIQRTQKTVFQL